MPILDKYPSMDEQSKCDEEQFECVEGVCNKVSLYCKDSCIAKSWVFDDEIDCTDESDEVDYKLDINCYWAIYAPNASKLQLTISDFGFSDEVMGKITKYVLAIAICVCVLALSNVHFPNKEILSQLFIIQIVHKFH